MRNLKQYKLFRRTRTKGKPIYYVQFRQADGSWSTAASTGCTVKSQAETEAIRMMREREFINAPVPMKLSTFAEGFFEWDATWAMDKRVTGKRISRQRCIEYARLYEKYVLPALGDRQLKDITKDVLKTLRNRLYEEKTLSGAGVNKVLMLINFILSAAEDKGLIQYVPKVDRVSQRAEKTKGILTIEEARLVLNPTLWDDHRAFVMSLTAASTGLRQGELLGLRIKNFKGHYLEVTQGWNAHMGTLNETTKTGRARNVIIPRRVQEGLQALIDINPWIGARGDEAFIFFNSTRNDRPTDGSYMLDCLYRAIKKAGITEKERAERNITFHSWRYFLNSMLINAKIPLQKVQSITGHLTAEMSQHYYSLSVGEMEDVLEIQEGLFGEQESSSEVAPGAGEGADTGSGEKKG